MKQITIYTLEELQAVNFNGFKNAIESLTGLDFEDIRHFDSVLQRSDPFTMYTINGEAVKMD